MSKVVYLNEWKAKALEDELRNKCQEFFTEYGWLPLKKQYIVEDMMKFEEKLKNEQEKLK